MKADGTSIDGGDSPGLTRTSWVTPTKVERITEHFVSGQHQRENGAASRKIQRPIARGREIDERLLGQLARQFSHHIADDVLCAVGRPGIEDCEVVDRRQGGFQRLADAACFVLHNHRQRQQRAFALDLTHATDS